jgi:hypothetical protein
MGKPGHEWVRKELEGVRARTDPNRLWRLFEPTNAIYEKLRTGEDADLEHVNSLIGRHLCLPHTPMVRYEWGLKLSPQAVGDIKLPGSVVSLIRVPFSCLGKPYLIGAVLAHEMSHQWLFLNGISYDDEDMNEKLTDLTAFAIGLGKLMLNGISKEASGLQGLALKLGYLEPELMLYAYEICNKWNGISLRESTKLLNNDVLLMVRKFRVSLE